MNRIKYLASVFIGVFVYVGMSMLVGQNSIRCYKEMELQKMQISRHTSEIENINEELRLEYAALRDDKDVIAAYARKLDYVCDEEKLVKITGLKPIQTVIYNTGNVMRHHDIECVPEKYCKLAGLCFFFMSALLIFLFDLNKGNISFKKKQNTPLLKGIPIYDIPQI